MRNGLAAQAPKTIGPDRRFATLRAVTALMLREMATRYGRSPGGYAWALLEPVGTIAILSIGFAIVIRSPGLGNSFVLFFATGFLPFNLYQTVSIAVSKSINFSRPLLMYPAVTWADAVLARLFLNALTGLAVFALIMGGVLVLTRARVVIDILPLVTAAGLTIGLAAGIGVLNCALTGLIPVWAQVWSIATRPLFLISGVFFIPEDLPLFARDILWWNPLTHVIGMTRAGLYPTYTPAIDSPAWVLAVALVTLFLGVVLMGRWHRHILNDQ